MTATGVQDPAAGASPAPAARAGLAVLRLPWLYLVSRRVPVTMSLVAGLAALTWSSLHWHWGIAGGPAAQAFIPLTFETGAAAVVAVTTYGSFGETERATGRWLPYLRLGAAVALTAVAYGALAAGATGGQLPGGALALLRNLTGIIGIGLVCAAALGGAFGWTGPLAYLLVTEVALTGKPTTPWVWAARPPHDLGGALCAALVLVAGITFFTLVGARDSGRRPAPE
jgi:hypothetical protein